MATRPTPVILFLLFGAACGAGVAWAVNRADPADATDAVVREDGDAAAPAALRGEGAGPAGAGTATEAHLEGSPEAAAHAEAVAEKNETLKAAVAELEAEIAALEPENAEVDPRAFRFGVTAKAPNFDAADWEGLAGHMLELSKVLVGIRDEVLATGQPSSKSMDGIRKHNTPLGLFALSIGPEMGAQPHVAYTHPAVIANLIRAALAESGDPLTRSQEIAIATLGNAWQREMEAKGPATDVAALARLVTEVEAKLRFLAEVKSVLTSSQRALLFDPETEGRVQLDLLSPSWVFAMRNPQGYPDRDAMETGLVESLLGYAEIEMDDVSDLRWAARAWVEEAPRALVPQSRLSKDIVFTHVDDLVALARAQVRAVERLVGSGAFSPEQNAALLGVTWVLHPFLQKTAPAAPEGSD